MVMKSGRANTFSDLGLFAKNPIWKASAFVNDTMIYIENRLKVGNWGRCVPYISHSV